MKLFFKKSGEGKPLIILHGLLGSADNWQTISKKLSETYTVYIVDQRNHGHSPHTDEINYDLMSEDLYDLVAEEGLRDLLLMGHSMGGKTVLRFAQQHGFLVEKMIVADMGIKAYPPHHDLIFQGLFAVDVDNCPTRKEAEERLSSIVKDEANVQFLMKNLYWKEAEKLAWRFNLQSLSDNRGELMKAIPPEPIDVPTLFLRGGKSRYVLDEDIDDIKKIVPEATFKTIENAGHWVHAEAPQEFLNEVSEYFAT